MFEKWDDPRLDEKFLLLEELEYRTSHEIALPIKMFEALFYQ